VYYVGDVPAQPLVIPLDDSELALSAFSGASATLKDGAGATVSLSGATFALDPSGTLSFQVNWGSNTRFTTPGLYALYPTITGAGGVTQRLPAYQFVVEQEDGWQTLDSAQRATNRDFPADELMAWTLLQVAKAACLAYEPLADDEPVPVGHRQAQMMQARNVLNSSKIDPSVTIDPSVFTITVYPLDNWVKDLLRPRKGVFGWVG